MMIWFISLVLKLVHTCTPTHRHQYIDKHIPDSISTNWSPSTRQHRMYNINKQIIKKYAPTTNNYTNRQKKPTIVHTTNRQEKPSIVHTTNRQKKSTIVHVQIEIHRKKQEEEETVKTKTISTAVRHCNNVCNKNQNWCVHCTRPIVSMLSVGAAAAVAASRNKMKNSIAIIALQLIGFKLCD